MPLVDKGCCILQLDFCILLQYAEKILHIIESMSYIAARDWYGC